MRIWERSTYTVEENSGVFSIISHAGESIAEIFESTEDNFSHAVQLLDAGECVDGWEDGVGNTIRIPKKATTLESSL